MQNFKRKHKVLFLHVNIVFAISYAVYMHLSEFGKKLYMRIAIN